MARPADDLMAWVVELPTGRRLRHSTWNGMLLAPADLLLADPSRVPRPNRMAVARAIVLGYCDGLRTTREIEAAVLRDHPALFPSAEEISRVVALVLARETE
jgi:protein arginine N-methyltransferase 1